MKTYIVRVFHKQLGGHTHLRVFTGHLNPVRMAQMAYAGELVMTNEEFAAWQDSKTLMQFVSDDRDKNYKEITKEVPDGRSSNKQTGD
jgi:hypothetical protein